MVRPKSSRPPARRSNAPGSTAPTSLPKIYDDVELTETDQTGVIAPNSVRTARRPTLMVMSGSLAGNVIRLANARTSIGRGKNADVTLLDSGVSRIHCVFERDASGAYFVVDQKSTNGTIVNGQAVVRAELKAGDRIQVGAEAVLQFSYFDDAEEELAKRMYDGATRDPLTGVFNRRHFVERLASEVSYAARHRDRLVAVMLDIDHFKAINDTLGHAAGDDVLRRVGATLSSLLRTEDICARYGGEEFVVLARGLVLPQGVKLAERIRSAVERQAFAFAGRRFKVTISAGVAELAEVKGDLPGEALLALADARLYRAKGAGRNRVFAG